MTKRILTLQWSYFWRRPGHERLHLAAINNNALFMTVRRIQREGMERSERLKWTTGALNTVLKVGRWSEIQGLGWKLGVRRQCDQSLDGRFSRCELRYQYQLEMLLGNSEYSLNHLSGRIKAHVPSWELLPLTNELRAERQRIKTGATVELFK